MKTINKITAFVLLLSMIVSASLVSCGNKDNDDTDKSTSTTDTITTSIESSETEEVSETVISDDLPNADYEGYKFRIGLSVEKDIPYVLAPELNGDVVNDAVNQANNSVEERFNVELESSIYDDVPLKKVKTTILAGDDVYDLVSGHDISMGNISLSGIFMDVNKLPNLNYEKPWWPGYSVDSLTVGGHMYLFSNYISYLNLAMTRVMYFNKQILNNYNMEVPYDDVFNGVWTLDKFIGMAQDTYDDINGDGIKDKGDLYGFAGVPDLYAFQESFGITPIKEDDSGKLYIDINNENTISLIEKVHSLLYESKGGYIDVWDTDTEIFSNNRSLFHFSDLRKAVDVLRLADVDYGILPIPKFNETQENYISGSTDRPYAVPITVKNNDLIGTIIEAMSAEGYKQVRPAYFDIAMKKKFTYDDESSRILDIVGNTIILDFSFIYSDGNGFAWTLMNMLNLKTHNTDFASYYAKNIAAQEKAIANIQAKYDEMAS